MDVLSDIKEFCLRHKHIYLYGAGMYAMHMQEFLRSELVEIDGCIVSSKGDAGNDALFEAPIYTIDEVNYSPDSCGVIYALSKKYHSDVDRILRQHGFRHVLAVSDDVLKRIKHEVNLFSLKMIQAYRSETGLLQNTTQENILVVRMDGIGDMVLTTPFLRELRRNHPSASITMVTSPVSFELFEFCPYLDEILMYDWQKTQKFPLKRKCDDIQKFVRRNLQNYRYSLAVVPRWGPDSYGASFLAFLSGATRRVAYSEKVEHEKEIFNQNYDSLFTDLLYNRNLKHEVERSLDILLWMHDIVCDTRLELWETKLDRCRIKSILKENVQDGLRLVAIGISASTDKKKWDMNNYLRLIQSMHGQAFRFVLIGGAEDKALARKLFASCEVINLVGELSLRETVALMRHVVLYVGNDTGIMHIAAACGVRIVEIRGNDDVIYSTERFHPWGVEYALLQSPNATMCEDVNAISLEDVVEKAARFLNGYERKVY